MNRLDPELKKLMRWARQAPEPTPAPMPFRFSSRVAECWNSIQPVSEFLVWQKAIWGSAWAAMAVILLGMTMLGFQKLRTSSPYDFSPAYQAVSLKFVP
jgi:hypothetical protein